MKLVKQASGKKTIKMSRKEWTDLGKKAGWFDPQEEEYRERGARKVYDDREVKLKNDIRDLQRTISEVCHVMEFNMTDDDMFSYEAIEEYASLPQFQTESEEHMDRTDSFCRKLRNKLINLYKELKNLRLPIN